MNRSLCQMSRILLIVATVLVSMNACTEVPDPQPRLSEICGKDFPDNEWVEIYNPSDQTIDLEGYYLIKIDEDGIDHIIRRLHNRKLGPGEYLLLSKLDNELRTKIPSAKEVGIELIAPDDKTVDAFYRDDEVGENAHPAGGSYARIGDSWTIVATATPGEPNESQPLLEDIEAEFESDYE